jgi:hypothetical protein
MSRRNNILATFERKNPTLDYFSGEVDEWSEVTKAWGRFETEGGLNVGEQVENEQVANIRRAVFRTIWTPAMARVDSACRMTANVGGNERSFQINQIVNVGEQNREIQLNVEERV